MKIKEIKSRLNELDRMELPDKEIILERAYKAGTSITETERPPKLRRRPRFLPAAAACLILLCAAGIWISHTTVTQAKNYRNAVDFFEKYELSMEDLTKDEITEVYFDIIKGTFSLEKTEQVIHKRVLIHDITQDITTSEQLDALWEKIENSGHSEEYGRGIDFEVEWEYYEGNSAGVQRSNFAKYENGKEQWKISIGFGIEDFYAAEDCVIVSGDDICTLHDENGNPSWEGTTYIAAVDMQGNILWENKFSHGYECEAYIEMAAGGQTITVFSRGEDELMITSFDYDGNCLKHMVNNELSDFCDDIDGHIQKMICYGDYIYTQIVSSKGEGYWNPEYYILKINNEGCILETLNYAADGMRYDIVDMVGFNGKLYLNGFAYESKDGEWVIDAVEKAVAEITGGNIFEEFTKEKTQELTQRTREIMSAVLLVCDAETGTIQEAFRVNGSKGGRIKVNEEKKLIWEVYSIGEVYFRPYMSSHIFDIYCQVYRYTFDGSGVLTDSEITDKAAPFWL